MVKHVPLLVLFQEQLIYNLILYLKNVLSVEFVINQNNKINQYYLHLNLLLSINLQQNHLIYRFRLKVHHLVQNLVLKHYVNLDHA